MIVHDNIVHQFYLILVFGKPSTHAKFFYVKPKRQHIWQWKMRKPIVALVELAQKPPHVLILAPSCTYDSMNGFLNSTNKLKLNENPNYYGINVIPIPIIAPTMWPNSKEPTIVTTNAMVMGCL